MSLRIGIDFDNTIAGYDAVFAKAAVDMGFLEPGVAGTKATVRASLLERPGGEEAWMRLQGRVYGKLMSQAELLEGVGAFLLRCRDHEVAIVSHKTRHGHFDPERVDLHEASRRWLAEQGFFAPDRFALSADRVYFEPSRDAKIARIRALGCTHFIDDLPEVLGDPAFPAGVVKLLLAPAETAAATGPYIACRSWREIADAVFDHAA